MTVPKRCREYRDLVGLVHVFDMRLSVFKSSQSSVHIDPVCQVPVLVSSKIIEKVFSFARFKLASRDFILRPLKQKVGEAGK